MTIASKERRTSLEQGVAGGNGGPSSLNRYEV